MQLIQEATFYWWYNASTQGKNPFLVMHKWVELNLVWNWTCLGILKKEPEIMGLEM